MRLKCSRCGHHWEYRGKSTKPTATCPGLPGQECGAKVKKTTSTPLGAGIMLDDYLARGEESKLGKDRIAKILKLMMDLNPVKKKTNDVSSESANLLNRIEDISDGLLKFSVTDELVEMLSEPKLEGAEEDLELILEKLTELKVFSAESEPESENKKMTTETDEELELE
jgi:hypothetical protein